LRHYTTELQDELDVNYCHLAAVSVDPPAVSAALRAGLGARFAILCDPDQRAIRELDIVDVTDTKHGPIAIPYTFSLGPDLVVHNVYNGWWYVGRPTAEELRRDLRTMMEKYRTDYHYPGPSA
jgi:peroxiredoxin